MTFTMKVTLLVVLALACVSTESMMQEDIRAPGVTQQRQLQRHMGGNSTTPHAPITRNKSELRSWRNRLKHNNTHVGVNNVTRPTTTQNSPTTQHHHFALHNATSNERSYPVHGINEATTQNRHLSTQSSTSRRPQLLSTHSILPKGSNQTTQPSGLTIQRQHYITTKLPHTNTSSQFPRNAATNARTTTFTDLPGNTTSTGRNATTTIFPGNITSTTHTSNSTDFLHNITSSASNTTTTVHSPNTTTPLRTTETTPPTVVPPSPKAGTPYGCQKVSPCVCQTEDGARVDLTPLARNDGLPRFLNVHATNDPYIYSWNPCYDFDQGTCHNVAMCQYDPGAPQNNTYYDLGNQQSVDYEVSSSRGLMIKYFAPAPRWIPFRISYVQLRCDPNVEVMFTADGQLMKGLGVYYFTLVSRYACLVGGRNKTTTPIPTPPTPGPPVTVVPGPTDNPIYNLKTVVDLLFAVTITAAVGVLVLLLLLVAVIVKRKVSGVGRNPPDYTTIMESIEPNTKIPM